MHVHAQFCSNFRPNPYYPYYSPATDRMSRNRAKYKVIYYIFITPRSIVETVISNNHYRCIGYRYIKYKYFNRSIFAVKSF